MNALRIVIFQAHLVTILPGLHEIRVFKLLKSLFMLSNITQKIANNAHTTLRQVLFFNFRERLDNMVYT